MFCGVKWIFLVTVVNAAVSTFRGCESEFGGYSCCIMTCMVVLPYAPCLRCDR
jgi:hypothetical protein